MEQIKEEKYKSFTQNGLFVFILFHKSPNSVPQAEMIVAHQQKNNKCSDFTNDTLVDAKYLLKIFTTFIY